MWQCTFGRSKAAYFRSPAPWTCDHGLLGIGTSQLPRFARSDTPVEDNMPDDDREAHAARTGVAEAPYRWICLGGVNRVEANSQVSPQTVVACIHLGRFGAIL